MSDVAPVIIAPPPVATTSPEGRHAVMLLAAAVLGSVMVVGALIAAGIAVAGRSGWWSGWSAAMVISLLAAVCSLVPVSAGVLGGTRMAAYGYLAGAAIRMLVTLGGCMMAVLAVRTAPRPTLLIAVPLYFAQLVAEPLVLRRALARRATTAK